MASIRSADGGRTLRLVGPLLALHLLAHAAHGIAHAAIPVVLGPALTASVALLIFVLPTAGFLLLWRGVDRLGVALFTVAMAASLLLAGVLHFVVPNPDNVASIPAGAWQVPFQLTALLLVPVDAIGTVVGVQVWRRLDGTGDTDVPQTGRIAGVPDAGFRPLTRLTYWVSRRWFGEVPEPLAVTAHHRALLAGASAVETALDRADHVDERLTELAVLKAATVVGCEFCIDVGTSLATDHGVTERQLRDLQNFEDSDAFSDRERLVLRYAVAMSTTPVDVPDKLFDALADAFDEPQLVELTAAIAFENYRARFNHAFGIAPQGFAEGSYCPRPDGAPAEGVGPGTGRGRSVRGDRR